MSQDIADTRTHGNVGSGVFSLVVLLRVDLEFCEDVAGVGDDGCVGAVDEADDLGAGVCASDAEVEQCACVAEAD